MSAANSSSPPSLRLELQQLPPVSERNDLFRMASLSVPVEWMRICERCGGEQRFVAGWVCKFGLVGCCAVCGEERIAPFTRTV
jgi:hypothetical protein